MRLLETYSRNCSVEIKHKPTLNTKFFPLGEINKYITIQTKSGMPAKDYSYYQEVVNLLFPILEKEGIKILHLGQDSPPLNRVVNLNNQTSLAQCAFILKKSLLHAGADSWMAHFCGAEEVPLVSLYGSTTVTNHSPYHFNKDKTIFLESHRNGNKATFAREENPKTIDLINPEDIARAVCKLLNLDFDYSFKTLLIGSAYNNRTIESCNDAVIDITKLGVQNLIIRNDYNHNLNNVFSQLQHCPCAIVTDKPLPIEPLVQLRQNVIEILYEITEQHSPEFVKQLFDNKIPFRLYTKLSEEKLRPIKLQYLDFPHIIFRKSADAPEILKDKNLSNIYYKSARFLLGNGKIYSSFWDYKTDRAIPSFESVPLQVMDINLDELWADKEYLYLLEKV
jgi:hypothetical protein